MPPRKSTSSVTPADPDDSLLQSPPAQQTDKPIFATEQQLKARAEAGVSVEDYLLPRSLTIRLAKAVLPPNTTIQKDAVLAMQKAATVFVSYLSSHANDATLKRTIAPSDVFNALSELELDSFRGRLEQELEAYTDIKAGKRKPKKTENGAVPGSEADVSGIAVGDGDGDGDVEMTDNPAKRMKRDEEGGAAPGVDAGAGTGADAGDETQEEELEEEDEEDEEDEEEEEEEGEGEARPRPEDDLEVVEDLDREPGARKGPFDPDAEDTDEDEDGPGSQLRDNLGLG
ncbi:Histone-fold [Penicillium nucicola]|uniref:Histone-fold n=1 Tax=Penicillium nucicola TaxID=1850975 RepID=UPI0025457643|nr:Histone-fold [Penicillium nucicola]KAJ5767092.1 Histone-fold [Penicillium nucicola]